MNWLTNPEAQKDPHYWVSVFGAHTAIGAVLWVFFLDLVDQPVFWASLSYLILWELVQYLIYRANGWDSILDWIAVTFGALISAAIWEHDMTTAKAGIFSALIIATVGGLVRR